MDIVVGAGVIGIGVGGSVGAGVPGTEVVGGAVGGGVGGRVGESVGVTPNGHSSCLGGPKSLCVKTTAERG